MIIDLSIDFDFFIREDWRWDWGHRDAPFFRGPIWDLRYAGGIDLFEETAIETYADFHPRELIDQLWKRRVRFEHVEALAVADSHMHAYTFFIEQLLHSGPPDRLLSLDAHHDWFGGLEEGYVDCGNWLKEFVDSTATALGCAMKPIVIYPGWKDPKMDGLGLDYVHGEERLEDNFEFDQWPAWWGSQFTGVAQVRNIFICRSGAWVPPHHDHTFTELVALLGEHASETVHMEPTEPRDHISPEDAARLREKQREMMDEFNRKRAEEAGDIVVSPQD